MRSMAEDGGEGWKAIDSSDTLLYALWCSLATCLLLLPTQHLGNAQTNSADWLRAGKPFRY